MVANMLMASGFDRLMTMDLHADQIQGFFEVPVDHLFASSLFAPYLKSLNINPDDLVIAAPDAGGSKRANAYAKYLNVDLALCYKQRKKANEISDMTVIGDVKNKHVVIIDDMVDTAAHYSQRLVAHILGKLAGIVVVGIAPAMVVKPWTVVQH